MKNSKIILQKLIQNINPELLERTRSEWPTHGASAVRAIFEESSRDDTTSDLLYWLLLFTVSGEVNIADDIYQKLLHKTKNIDITAYSYIQENSIDTLLHDYQYSYNTTSHAKEFILLDICEEALTREVLQLSLHCPVCRLPIEANYYSGYFTHNKAYCPKCLTQSCLPLKDLREKAETALFAVLDKTKTVEEQGEMLARMAVLLNPFLLILFLKFMSSRIGHFVANTAFFLTQVAESVRQPLLFAAPPDPSTVSNGYLTELWSRKISILPAAEVAYSLLSSTENFSPLTFDLDAETGWQGGCDGRYLAKTPSLFCFTDSEHEQAREWLAAHNGAPYGYVCFHCRDNRYLSSRFPTVNWAYHDYRDVDISTYVSSMNWVASQNIPVFRMGTSASAPLRGHGQNVYDFARRERTEFLDIYLSAHCLFYVACASGPDTIPLVMGRPVLYTNVPQYTQNALLCAPHACIIFKKIYCNESKRLLSLREIFRRGLGEIYFASIFKKHNVSLIANTQKELVLSVQEMHARATGSWKVTAEEHELRRRYVSIMSQWAPQCTFNATIGYNFLTMNTYLLDDD